MINWLDANRTAMIAAAHAHGDYCVDLGTRIAVVEAARRAGLVVATQPLPRLFGLFVDRPVPAAMINSRLDVYAQRQTVAHELGHHVLNHGMRADIDLEAIFTAKPGVRSGWAATSEERTAEAFAAWFLMPRTAVRATAKQLDIDRITSVEHVYRIALALGVPFATLLRHLPNLRMLSAQMSREWVTIPRALPRRLLNRGLPALLTRTSDVWHLTERCTLPQIVARPRDRIIVTLPSVNTAPGWRVDQSGGLTAVPAPAAPILSDESAQVWVHRFVIDLPSSNPDGAQRHQLVLTRPTQGAQDDQRWTVTVVVADTRHGVSPVWLDGKGDEDR